MTIVEKKKKLRSDMLEKRKESSPRALRFLSQTICRRLLELIKERKVQYIHSFIPMEGEVDLKPFLKEALKLGKTVVVPKTLKKPLLEHWILEDLDQLQPGLFGTQHPQNQNIYTGPYDMIVVPGLAFDDANNRLGYGGGYYDHFLKDHPDAFKVGVAFTFQMMYNVPIEENDVQLDIVLK